MARLILMRHAKHNLVARTAHTSPNSPRNRHALWPYRAGPKVTQLETCRKSKAEWLNAYQLLNVKAVSFSGRPAFRPR